MNIPLTKKHIMQKGFTLVEMLVSLTVFSIVMVISVGTLIVMMDANAKAQALYSSMTNLSFAIDTITREIRTGYHYHCGDLNDQIPTKGTKQDCITENGGNRIMFTRERDGAYYGYRQNGIVLEQYNGSNWIPITSSDDIEIETFSLRVANTGTVNAGGNAFQPRVDIFIKGKINNGLEVDTEFSIQTHVVQRRLDII